MLREHASWLSAPCPVSGEAQRDEHRWLAGSGILHENHNQEVVGDQESSPEISGNNFQRDKI